MQGMCNTWCECQEPAATHTQRQGKCPDAGSYQTQLLYSEWGTAPSATVTNQGGGVEPACTMPLQTSCPSWGVCS